MFNIALTGINAAQTYLDTTSNNIANAETYGFKYSRAEFADIYSSGIFTNKDTAVGLGTYTTTVSQQFVQGSLSGDTGNNLDLAISGNGFFVLSSECNPEDGSNTTLDRTYTRNGAFQLDDEGYIVTATGEYLQGWAINDDGDVVSLDLNTTFAIQIPENTGAPQQSSEVGIGVQLPANTDALEVTSFDHTDSDTYTCSTSQTIYDSLGNTHTLTYYFINAGVDETTNETTWYVVCYVDGEPVDIADVPDTVDEDTGETISGAAVSFQVTDVNSDDYYNTYYCFTLTFDTSGELVETVPPALYLATVDGTYTSARDTTTEYTDYINGILNGTLSYAMGGGVATDQVVHIAMTATQYGSSSFTISETAWTDGYAMGYLTNVEVDEDGIIWCEYSNGESVALCKVAMATFINEQGLTKVGDTQWKESADSGEATPVEANTGTAGTIYGANLELSNVDLTVQLVELIIAQRYYQCNAQSLQTQNNVMDAILSI